jgi:hypothetical protein
LPDALKARMAHPLLRSFRMTFENTRAIDWFESTSRSIHSQFPEIAACTDYLTERLSALMLERLPPVLRSQLISMLPDGQKEKPRHLARIGRTGADSSIGFPDFVERAKCAMGVSDGADLSRFENSDEEYDRFCQKVAEIFLWSFAQELPPDMKIRMHDSLPMDLRSRMNLYSGYSEQEKVA